MSLNKKETKNLDKIYKLEVLHSNGSKLEGIVLAIPNDNEVTSSLSGIVCNVESDDTYYLDSDKGIRFEEGVIKFTLFPSDGSVAKDYILKEDSGFYYGCCYDGKRNANCDKLVSLRITESNEKEKAVIGKMIEWFANHGKAINNNATYLEFVNKSNVTHHEFSDSIFENAKEYFNKKFILAEGTRKLNVEKKLLEDLLIARIYGDEEDLETGKETFTKINECVGIFVKCMQEGKMFFDEPSALFIHLVGKKVEKDELNSLRESAKLSFYDASEYLAEFARIQTQYNVDAELLKIILWYFNKNCDKKETSGTIEQALSDKDANYAFRNELLGQSLYVPYSDINYDPIRAEVLKFIEMIIKHRFSIFEREVIVASNNLETDKIESLKTLLLLQMVACFTVIKSLNSEISIDTIVEETKNLLCKAIDRYKDDNINNASEVGKTYTEKKIALCNEVISYLDNIVSEALKLSSDYLEKEYQNIKSE